MFKSCQEYIEKRINNQNLGYETEKCELKDAVLETLEQRQSSFILLIGQCGTGKKKIVKEIFNEITANKKFIGKFKIITMNGYLHSNDEIILRKLKGELRGVVEEEEDLSEEDEIIEEYETDEKDDTAVSDEDYFKQLKFLLEEIASNSLLLIFELQEFQKFCEPRKLFIHHLFDVINFEKVPICIIGMTDQICNLELPKSDKNKIVNRIILKPVVRPEERLHQFHSLLILNPESELPLPFIEKWNKNINKLFSDSTLINTVEEVIENLCEESFTRFMTSCVREWFFDTIWEANADEILSMKHIENVCQQLSDSRDIKRDVMNLTEVEHCLLIAICDVLSSTNSSSFNFETVYLKYKSVTDKWTDSCVSRCVALHAFSRLQRLGFITSEDNDESDTPIDFELYVMKIVPQLLLEVIEKTPQTTPEMREWINISLMSNKA